MIKTSASLLACDLADISGELSRCKAANVDWIHFDVMDGAFVDQITYGSPVLKCVRRATDMFLDVHLMVNDPASQIKFFAEAGADLISFHLESRSDARKTLELIRSFGVKSALAVKPGTPIEEAFPLVELCDMVLVMTVEPGFGGQGFIPECMDKIKAVRTEIQKNGYKCELEIDGGAKLNNTADIVAAGADVIVAGSAVFGGDIAANVKGFHEVFKEGAAKAAWSK